MSLISKFSYQWFGDLKRTAKEPSLKENMVSLTSLRKKKQKTIALKTDMTWLLSKSPKQKNSQKACTESRHSPPQQQQREQKKQQNLKGDMVLLNNIKTNSKNKQKTAKKQTNKKQQQKQQTTCTESRHGPPPEFPSVAEAHQGALQPLADLGRFKQ